MVCPMGAYPELRVVPRWKEMVGKMRGERKEEGLASTPIIYTKGLADVTWCKSLSLSLFVFSFSRIKCIYIIPEALNNNNASSCE